MEDVMNAPTTVPAIAEPRPALIAGARPRPIVPTDMDQVWRLAQAVVKSGMAPRDMQKTETVTIAIMHGLEVGLTPLMALQRIAVINGRPAIWGDAAMGLARASGLCEYVYEVVNGEGDHMVAVCRAKRKGEKDPIERTFSVADAKKAGLWDKAGPWKQYPKRMLQMRARAFTLRDLFADVLGGLYIAEELDGDEAHPVRQLKDVTPRPVVTASPKAELPPVVSARQEAAIEPESTEAEPVADEAPVETTKKPLPPVARTRRTEPKDGLEIPAHLRRAAPPADEPEAFRDWFVVKLNAAKTAEEIQILWDSHVQPNVDSEQILPPDLEDLKFLTDTRTKAIEDQ